MDQRDLDELRMLIQKVARRIRSNRGDDRVSDSALAVLFHLDARGELTPGALADLEHLTPPSMNRTLNGLETAGLVVRSPSNDDARKVLVSLTPTARALLEETRRLRRAWLTDQIAALDPDERDLLRASIPVLRKLADS